ncbi:phosphotransferase family protein [Mycobacterium sp. E1747]|uniref:phosphotransferase family protein n=1 Tax=Mycobacterium sp. E1747 TaxID=1834128 RepID=UPI0009EE082B|nr:phosphotransferase family protein [Mycobacterium sp. E1747]
MDIAALRRFLLDCDVAVQGELVAEPIDGGRSNLTFKVRDERSTWVVRRPPVSGSTPSAHDMGREYAVTKALRGSAVPVARTVALDADGRALGVPLSIVEFVDGAVIRSQDDLSALSSAQVDGVVESLVKTMAALHAVDYQAVGLGSFGRPEGFLTRQVALWARQWERVKGRELPDMAALTTGLADLVPKTPPVASIVHGDFRIDNTILDRDRPEVIRAVVDWELSTIGDPLSDVALMCVYRSAAFDLVLGISAAWTSPRLPSADALAERYARASGRDLTDWNFYLALANLKLAVISEGISHRSRLGSDAGSDAAGAMRATPEFVAAGLAALR